MFSLANITSQQLLQFIPISHAAALNGRTQRKTKLVGENCKETNVQESSKPGDSITSSLQLLLKAEPNVQQLLERISPVLSHISAVRDGVKLPTVNSGYISNHTFFENRYGFSEEQLTVEPPMLLYNYLVGHPSTLLNGTSVRHFKTQRSSISDDDRTSSVLDRLKRNRLSSSAMFGKSRKSTEADHLKTLLTGENLTPEEQQKLKLAFAEGFVVGETTGAKKTKSQTRLLNYLQVAYYAFSVVLLFYVFRIIASMLAKPPSSMNSEVAPEDRTVTFDDVKGADEAKTELQEIVEFLRDPERFSALGGKIPRGVLLVGPPGTGKTLLAKAVAGEAGVPYFQAAGSEFDEMLVGMGAKRVRDLFSSAKARAPCVIFIDEIDSVGGKRTNSSLNPFANQTINQLLSVMDGFHSNEGVIVLGATNRRDDLDKALLRPGRFDMEIQVPAPDLGGRVDILKLYLAKVKTSNDVNVESIARGTTGFTGADIENLVNQAALRAAIDGATAVSMKHLEFSRDKILMGPERKSRIPDEECNKITAYHEAGHALVAHYTRDSHPLHKVTIIPRGSSLGHTAYMPEKERYHVTKSQLLASMDGMMGGRAAEELIFGQEKVTSGAASDLQQATSLATHMVKSWGMSDKVGLRYFDDNSKSMVVVNDLSQGTSEAIDSEIRKILQESYERAKQILIAHKEEHKNLAEALIKYETLDAEDVKAILEKKEK